MALLDKHKKAVLDEVFKRKLFIRPATLAKLLDRSRSTLYRWIDEGFIEYADRTPGIKKQILFDRATVEEIIRKVITSELYGEQLLANKAADLTD